MEMAIFQFDGLKNQVIILYNSEQAFSYFIC